MSASDSSDAEDSEITVSGTVSVEGVQCTAEQFSSINIEFISESHCAVATAKEDGTYEVKLKSNNTYSVRSFNFIYIQSTTAKLIFTGTGMTQMSYVCYKDYTAPNNNATLNICLEKGVEYTLEDGSKYYLYNSGFATLTHVEVKYGTNNRTVIANQVITVPEIVSKDGKDYQVTFIGSSVTEWGGCIITGPSDYINKSLFKNTNELVIHFKGNVILNYNPITSAWGPTYCGSVFTAYKFHVMFDKDVSINSYPIINDLGVPLITSTTGLIGIQKISIGGIYHGGITTSKTDSNPKTINDGQNLVNCTLKTVTFDPKLVFSQKGNKLIINSLGLYAGGNITATSNGTSYQITDVNGTAISTATEVIIDPITITARSNTVSYTIVAKGSTCSPAEPTITTENQRFAGWYTDAECTKRYDASVALTADTTVYAKIVTMADDQVLFTTVVDGVKYYNVVSKATYTPENPTTTNKNLGDFEGWYTDAEYTTKYDASIALTKDTTVYAKFKVVSATVNLVEDGKILKSYENIAEGKTITLQTSETKGFEGWSINGLLLGAQYTVSLTDADTKGNITLNAKIAEEVKTTWNLTVSGTGIDGKVFCTASNLIGTYGMITVLPGEFEEFGYEIKSANAVVGEISDSCLMVSSKDGKDVEISIEFKDVGKAAEYTVSIAEITADGKSGFRATLTADDGGYIDTDGTLAIGYVYKVYNETEKAWVYTTSGSTEGVTDCTVEFKDKAVKTEVFSGDFTLDKTGAYLVYGYAKYSYKDASATSTTVTVTSPVIVSFVSTVQAVIGKS